MRISDWSSDVCSSDLPYFREALFGRASYEPRHHDLPARLSHRTGKPVERRDGGAVVDLTARRNDRAAPGEGCSGNGGADRIGPRGRTAPLDRKSPRLNSSHSCAYRMPPSACNTKK